MAAVNILTHFEFCDEGEIKRERITRHIPLGGRAYLRRAQELAQQFADQAGCTVQAESVNNESGPSLGDYGFVTIVHPKDWSR